jgi:hypothetical protein
MIRSDLFLLALPWFLWMGHSTAFQVPLPQQGIASKQQTAIFMSSFAADGSEYSSKDSGIDDDDDMGTSYGYRSDLDENADVPTVELQPVPMSKNSGSRFVALVWDHELDTKGRDALDLHYDRDDLCEEHVMFCRKRNLYNETFNTDSMVDILHSFPM